MAVLAGEARPASAPQPRADSVPQTRAAAATSTARVGVPFLLVHAGVLAVFVVGWSWAALCGAVVLYVTRMLGITVFYHRGLAHRAFAMPRPVQLAGAILGAAAAQRGPLWWVATHRVHHRFTDRPGDPHSPVVDGFFESHVGWLFRRPTEPKGPVADLSRFPELRVVDRFHHVAPLLTALAAFGAGAALSRIDPGLHTSGPQMLVWGFFVSTTALYHATFSVNSVAHRFGRQRFDTGDSSRNNALVAALTLGEGWHNNHHRFPGSARQGLARFELDPSWWCIRVLAALRLASRPRTVRGAPFRSPRSTHPDGGRRAGPPDAEDPPRRASPSLRGSAPSS